MEYRKIPKTEIAVSAICLGTMTFGTPVSANNSVKLVHYAMERGINFIDTANIYEGYARHLGSAGGVAEECIGRAVKGRRGDVIIATKVGASVGNTPLDRGLKKEAIAHNLSKSLKRLDTDYVDIYYAHLFDKEVRLIELAGAMNDEIGKGRIRHWAVSNYTGAQMMELLAVCDANGLRRPVMSQPALSLMNLDAIGDNMYVCVNEDIAVAPYRILQSGLLTGKYLRNAPAPKGSRKAEHPAWVPDMSEEQENRLEAVRQVCEMSDVPMTTHAIRFVLAQPSVASAIVGVKTQAQIAFAADCVE